VHGACRLAAIAERQLVHVFCARLLILFQCTFSNVCQQHSRNLPRVVDVVEQFQLADETLFERVRESLSNFEVAHILEDEDDVYSTSRRRVMPISTKPQSNAKGC